MKEIKIRDELGFLTFSEDDERGMIKRDDYFRKWYWYKFITFAFISKFVDKSKTMLDIGGSVGNLAYVLQRFLARPAKYVCLDINKEFVEQAQKEAKPWMEFVHGTGTKIPFDDETFDIVTNIDVIEHLEEEGGKKMVSEMFRVLKPGGILILSTVNRDYLDPEKDKDWFDHHLRFWTPQEMEELLTEVGFEVKDKFGTYAHEKVIEEHFSDDIKQLYKTLKKRVPTIFVSNIFARLLLPEKCLQYVMLCKKPK